MCYSAKVKQKLRDYEREFGVRLNMRQFEMIFGFRAENPKIRIPRAVEDWFAEPRDDAERRIKGMIDAHRAKLADDWTREMFAQMQRANDARRELETKVTKKAENDLRIGEKKAAEFRARLDDLKRAEPNDEDGRFFPMHYAPIILREGGENRMVLARYHCRGADKPAAIDAQFPGLYNARRDNLTKFWRGEFGRTHAVCLIDAFFENVDRDGKNVVLRFEPKPPHDMLVACLYATWTPPGGGLELISFAAITDDPPPEIAAAGHDRCVVNLKPENVEAWLSPQGRTVAELQAILSDVERPYYEHRIAEAA